MKNLLSLILPIFCISVVGAQTPSEVLFNKYGNKKGVELFVTSQPALKVDAKNIAVSSVIREMSIAAEDEDSEKKSKLYNKVKRDCMKLFNNKDYVIIQQDKDDIESFTAFKYAKNGVLEMCVLTINEEKLTLESTLTAGLPETAIANAEINIKRTKM